MASDNKLGKFLTEVSNWKWDEFLKAEHDPKYTSNQAMIFALVRACAMQKMEAIKMSLNRLDGKLKTPIKIEYPKIFYLYPNAKLEEPLTKNDVAKILEADPETPVQIVSGEVLAPPPVAEPEVEPDLPSLSLRQTLTKMSDYPRELPQAIVQLALETEQWMKKNGPPPDEIPAVKSVVAAHLLILAQARNIDALGEVFDQIDGKLAEVIQLLGDDIYITSYALTAPPEAKVNKDGVLEVEATVAQDLWANKLGREATK